MNEFNVVVNVLPVAVCPQKKLVRKTDRVLGSIKLANLRTHRNVRLNFDSTGVTSMVTSNELKSV